MQIYTLFAILPLTGTLTGAVALNPRNTPETFNSISTSTSESVPSTTIESSSYPTSVKSCKRPSGTTSQDAIPTTSSEMYTSSYQSESASRSYPSDHTDCGCSSFTSPGEYSAPEETNGTIEDE
ncbi:hypothetical protein L486_02319 [Kwoniella mangroviensis CBS 10435]|uniref:Uncharacterized protein n=1 Tax=Kwoniella mangroviensis CBS 10435 TaxID=1331196 RepID=A0A1B9IVU2_9TREE|nr:hypothetical protein L486_02319 [Kwoniella mangroviensis CBS 10435]